MQKRAGGHRIVHVPLRVRGSQKTRHLVGVGVVGTALVGHQIGRQRRETDFGIASRDILVVLQQTSIFVNDHDTRVRAGHSRRHRQIPEQRRAIRGRKRDVHDHDVRIVG